MKNIGILGGGIWGSALAKLLSDNNVLIYARDQKVVDSINQKKISPKLKFSSFNNNVKSTLNISELQNSDYLFITLPVQNIREVLKNYSIKNKKQHIIIGSKGIEIDTKLFIKDGLFDIPEAREKFIKKFENNKVNENQLIIEGKIPELNI